MKNKDKYLSDGISISHQYQRSIRIDTDLGREDSLDGFICHDTAKKVIETMAIQTIETNQRAYTWTGPFGSGKSSLALNFASALSSNMVLRKKARMKLQPSLLPLFDKAFPVEKQGWLILPIVGKRTSFTKEIVKVLNTYLSQDEHLEETINSSTLIEKLVAISNSQNNDGVLLLIDEMGKFLESATSEGDDIHFFQDLAEAAARATGKLIIVGVLHQAFRAYANKLDTSTRDDWSKIQGRFSDIPLIVNSDEIVDLIGQAIKTKLPHRSTSEICELVTKSIQKRRPIINDDFAQQLDLCWPLHPTMSVLLGPISRKQFGQNERSTFTFLSSAEPKGFQEFLKTTFYSESVWYKPENYWEYIRANFDAAIQSSSDGHRWSQAVEAVERTEARVQKNVDLRVSLIKSISIINLFKNGSGLAADNNVLASLYPEYSLQIIEDALSDLSLWRVAVYRKHLSAWAIFEGSDFDIDKAISTAKVKSEKINVNELSKLAALHPIVAKRHYYKTGSLRWMDVVISSTDDLDKLIISKDVRSGSFGKFILALPNKNDNYLTIKEKLLEKIESIPEELVIGIPSNFDNIHSLGEELLALEYVKSTANGILEGDSVARREVLSRIDVVKFQLEEEVKKALSTAIWFVKGVAKKNINMYILASKIADLKFKNTPEIKSEILNRSKLSTSAVKARRELMHRMVNYIDKENLDLIGYPAERGLYDIVLKNTKLHQKYNSSNWKLYPPIKGTPLFTLWERTDDIFTENDEIIKVEYIYSIWGEPPFGIHDGLKPVLFLAYFLSRSNELSIYKNGMFLPTFTDVDVDELLQSEKKFQLRKVIIDTPKSNLLKGIGKVIEDILGLPVNPEPLDSARGLVNIVFGLPHWTQRTQRLTSKTKIIRDLLLKASDPYKILFIDLESKLGCIDQPLAYIDQLRYSINELFHAYKNMLADIREMMFRELGNSNAGLHKRCEVVSGVSGDFRFEAFVNRLKMLDETDETFEGILSLAVNKPSRNWNDGDISVAEMEIAKWVTRFKQYETYASVKGRNPTREAFAVSVGTGNTLSSRFVEFDISESERHAARVAVDNVLKTLSKNHSPEALLAAFAEAGIDIVESKVNG